MVLFPPPRRPDAAHFAQELTTEASRASVSKTLGEVQRRLGSVPPLDPVKDMAVADATLGPLLERQAALAGRLAASPVASLADGEAQAAAYAAKHELDDKVARWPPL